MTNTNLAAIRAAYAEYRAARIALREAAPVALRRANPGAYEAAAKACDRALDAYIAVCPTAQQKRLPR